MLKISLPWIVYAIASIDRLETIAVGQKVQDISYLCFAVQQSIDGILDNSVYSAHLKSSREHGSLLKESLDEMSPSNTDQQREVSHIDMWTIQNHGRLFKEILMAELNVLPAFLVVEKEGFDINALIESGHKLFPSSTLSKCPEAEKDIMESGKALAFELSTACGFHIFRVTETVLKRYWDHVSGDADRPDLETIGNYAKVMKEKNLGDEKISETLMQLAKLHRNPLIHPQVILTVEEAIETLGIARSAIGAMLRVMPDVLPTTTPQLAP